MERGANERRGGSERGVSVVLVAACLVALLAAGALAIDLGLLYVARSEAQRAADAAALAGATAFLSAGCTSVAGGCVAGGSQETLARQQAEAAGAQNAVAGQAAAIQDSDVTFSYPNPMEPQITVTVQRSVARGNTIPLFFAKIFGVKVGSVSARATAEAYNPSGGTVPVAFGCVVPFLVPNCDPLHTIPTNTSCNGGTGGAGYFIDPATHAAKNPGLYPAGAIGESWQLHSNAAPSQWYLIAFTGQSASNLRQYISQCAPETVACGSTLQTMNGNKVGPTDQGTDARINASADGLGQGQDTISTTNGLPFAITGGANNPDASLAGKVYYGPSASQVLAPVYDGHALNPGGDTVTVVGFMELFIQDAQHSGTSDLLDTVVMAVVGCNTTPGPTPPITAIGGAPIPIRLIRTP